MHITDSVQLHGYLPDMQKGAEHFISAWRCLLIRVCFQVIRCTSLSTMFETKKCVMLFAVHLALQIPHWTPLYHTSLSEFDCTSVSTATCLTYKGGGGVLPSDNIPG